MVNSNDSEHLDRRGDSRVDHLKPAVVLARHNCGMEFVIESISVGGARLVGEMTLEVGERVQILFELDGRPVEVDAEVVRADRQDVFRDRIAVAFMNLSAHHRDSIRRLVQAALDLECERMDAALSP